jgi:hypothetical protein
MAMELFTQLFGDLLAFVYHCFDRIVINGYLSGLWRPERVVHFFRQIVGIPAGVLGERRLGNNALRAILFRGAAGGEHARRGGQAR